MLRHRINVGRHHIQRIGPVGLQFLPTDIAGLQLWLDANDASTLFQDAAGTTPAGNGDVVGAWADKSGQGNDATQTTTATKPTLDTVTGINSLPVVRGDTDDELDLVGVAVTNETVFTVVKHRVNNTFGVWVGVGAAHRVRFTDVANQARYRYNVTVGTVLTGFVETDANIFRAMYDGVNMSLAANNGTPVTDAATAALHSWLSVFSRPGAEFLDGDIGELLIYNSALSVPNVALVENYLSTKWGIAIA